MALRLIIKKVPTMPSGLKSSNLAGPKSGSITLLWTRSISGKNLYTPDPNKPPPFDAAERNFTHFRRIYDKTTPRLDENSKLIVVEGAHGIGKDKFSKDLADELSMAYVKEACADDAFINQYGFDYRQVNHLLPERMKVFDEKDFSRNPLGHVKGGTDRLFFDLYMLKVHNYFHSLKHILNTGQGVVMDGSVFSWHIYANAALRQGWIDPGTHETIIRHQKRTLPQLLRPNLIIYLDAPVDVVQRNIQASGNEWEQNSPVWTNKRYLTDIYNEFKNTYLRKSVEFSRVLVYDWSEGGEAEIVVEDIEKLPMDMLPRYDNQQKDWKLINEETAANARYRYANYRSLTKMLLGIVKGMDYYDNDHMWNTPEDISQISDLLYWSESGRYAVGFNEKLGDYPRPFETRGYQFDINQNFFPDINYWPARSTYLFEEDDDGFDYEAIKKVLEANGGRRPLNHNRNVLAY